MWLSDRWSIGETSYGRSACGCDATRNASINQPVRVAGVSDVMEGAGPIRRTARWTAVTMYSKLPGQKAFSSGFLGLFLGIEQN